MPRSPHLADDPLDLWRSIAELSPRALPEPGFARGDLTIKDYLREHRFPWDPVTGHLGGRGTWRHTVYAGLVPYRTLMTRAGLAFGHEPFPDDRGRPAPWSGLTPLLALQVGQDGAVDAASLEFSRACWTALSLSGFGKAVTDVEADARRWREAMLAVLRDRGVRIAQGPAGPASGAGTAEAPDEPTVQEEADPASSRAPRTAPHGIPERALEYEDLVALIEETHRIFEAGALRSERLLSSPARVVSILEDPASPRIPSLPLVNHPTAAPLAEASEASRFRQAAAGLLGIEAAEAREDVATAPRLMYSAVAPRELPLGALDAGGASIATQFSVNRALAGGEGLWAVPATLSLGVEPERARRLLLAALITRRSRALAELPDPAEAFDPEPSGRDGSPQAHAPHPDLTGFGVLRARPLDGLPAGEGCLGARAGILAGMEETGLYPGLLPGERYDAVEAVDAVLGVLGQRSAEPAPAEYEEWDRLTRNVLASQERAEQLLAARQRYHEAVPMLMRAQHLISQTARQLSGVRGTEQSLGDRLRTAEAEHRSAWDRTNDLSDVIAAHLSAAPGVVRRTVTLGRAIPPWRQRLDELRDRRDRAERAEGSARARRDELQRELDRARADAEALREELREAAATVRGLQDELAAYPHPAHAVDQDWLAGDWQEDTAATPWLDAEVQRARVEAHRNAVLLHGLALRFKADEVREGLLLARKVLGGRPASDTAGQPDPDAVAAAWQVLLTVFPEVDVAVELVPRLCASLGHHRIDWMVLTEAERIDPGTAYAALRHARRAVLLPSPERERRRAGVERPSASATGRPAGGEPGRPEDEDGRTGPAGAFEEETARMPRHVLYHSPPEEAQRRLAEMTGCSVDWAPACADALSLARRQSRYTD